MKAKLVGALPSASVDVLLFTRHKFLWPANNNICSMSLRFVLPELEKREGHSRWVEIDRMSARKFRML